MSNGSVVLALGVGLLALVLLAVAASFGLLPAGFDGLASIADRESGAGFIVAGIALCTVLVPLFSR